MGRSRHPFAVSYSGNTEETLELFDQARSAGARIIAVTSGGALADQTDISVVRVPGRLQPRAALGWLAVPVLVICERMGLARGVEEEIDAAIELLEKAAQQYCRRSPLSDNPAKSLALRLADKLLWIYGTEGLTEIAAYRWKCQMNECAKVAASSNCFPELTHNEIVGWDRTANLPMPASALLVLRDWSEHPRLASRVDSTIGMIEANFELVEQLQAPAASPLVRLLDLCYLGDFTSTYLAIARGVDPGAVELINRLKNHQAAADRDLCRAATPFGSRRRGTHTAPNAARRN